MKLTFDDLSETCDQFWECNCDEEFCHRKGTMPTRWYLDPEDYDNPEKYREDWNRTEYCPVCDADEQDCSDAHTDDLIGNTYLNLDIFETAQILVEAKKLKPKLE